MSELTPYYKSQVLKWFRIIGLYQIIGGVIGMVIFVQSIEALTSITIFIGLVINVYSIYAGYQLWRHNKLVPTYIIQGAQVLNFIGLGITYQIVIGIAVGLGFEWIENPDFVYDLKLMVFYNFKFTPNQTDQIRVVVNFIPVFIINYLMKRKEQAEEKKQLLDY